MRLINTQTLHLHFFMENAVPPYAILSHTWENDEMSLQEMSQPIDPTTVQKQGYVKIKNCCDIALKDGFEYAWVDTCCIDKTSSSELSEAINSMFKWYEEADVCYAYIADYKFGTTNGIPEESFRESRWFTRGWTLQELIAPKDVLFFNGKWAELGTKSSLRDLLSAITGIHVPALLGNSLSNYSIAQRMSWASERETTRSEDTAYCMMGIFQVNMPMLYGEGNRAFYRLQQTIIMHSTDHTLFAWENIVTSSTSILAESPACFKNSSEIVRNNSPRENQHFTGTNAGIHMSLSVIPDLEDDGYGVHLAVLDCYYTGRQNTSAIALRLRPYGGMSQRFYVDSKIRFTTVSRTEQKLKKIRSIFITQHDNKKVFARRAYNCIYINTTGLKCVSVEATLPSSDKPNVLTFPPESFKSTICAALVLRDGIGRGCVIAIYRPGVGLGLLEIIISEAEFNPSHDEPKDLSFYQDEMPHRPYSAAWEIGFDRQRWQHAKGGWGISASLKGMIVEGQRVIVLEVEDHVTS